MKVKLTEKEIYLISQTPPNECWVCDEILKHIENNKIDVEWLEKQGFKEHLEQVIGRKL
ncbi:MAG: hypothetical protein ACTSVB_05505 [Candidatus Heimdallarchaeaceae archaeon]